jgi:hypothetical protein
MVQLFKRILECLDGLERSDRDLHIDDRLGRQADSPRAGTVGVTGNVGCPWAKTPGSERSAKLS